MKPGDLVNLIAYQGTAIYELPAADFTVNTAADTVTLSPNANLTGVTEIAVSIATQASTPPATPSTTSAPSRLQIGQPVVNSSGNLVLNANDEVELYTAATIGNNATQTFAFTGGTNNSQSFTLNSAPNGFIDVTLAGTDLTPDQFQVSGTLVTVSPSFVPAQGSLLVITYRLTIMNHQRGEPIYNLSSHGIWVQATYSGGEPALYLGTEPILYSGGEQTFYTAVQPLQQAENVHQVTMAGGMPGAILFRGMNNLTIKGGSGNNTFTIVQTQLGSFGTPGTDSTPVTLDTGDGNDQVAIRSIESPVTVNAGNGQDTIDVGSLAGLWPDPRTGAITFLNINGFVADISALLTILGGTGRDTLNVDDTGDPQGVTGLLTSSQITGLRMAVGIVYQSITTLNVNLGLGNDTFNIQSTAAVTTSTVSNRGGIDTFNIGSRAGLNTPQTGGILDGIQGALVINGAGSDSLNVDDSGSAISKAGADRVNPERARHRRKRDHLRRH